MIYALFLEWKFCERLDGLRRRDIFQAKIEGVAFGGGGVARVPRGDGQGGITAFVPFTVDGDIVQAEVRSVKKRHLTGRLKKIVAPSPHRVNPPCRYFARCGGCCYQHIDYPHQLEIKHDQVVQALKRIGGVPDPYVRPVIASPSPYSYRGKAEFHFFRDSDGGKAGFFDISGANIIEIERCEILDESINSSLAEARGSLREGGRPREERLVLWSREFEPLPAPCCRLPGELNEPENKNNERITRVVKDTAFLVPRSGFFQNNKFLTGKMVDIVLEAARCSAGDSVLDLYCGSGLFSIFLAAAGARVLGIEAEADAVECARQNALNLGLGNAQFHVGQVEDQLKALTAGVFSVIVLDPPRAGCDKNVLSGIIDLKPDRVVYISCDPATQARDLRDLLSGGFSLAFVQPMDMFPQTMHIETVALLERYGK